MQESYNHEFNSWISRQRDAIELLALAGQLWYDKSVELILFRRNLIDSSPSEILNHHLYAKQVVGIPIPIETTLMLAKELAKVNLAPTRVDIGRLAFEWETDTNPNKNVKAFVINRLTDFIGVEKCVLRSRDVVLYGFGRIGRLAARILVSRAGRGDQLLLKAIVTREPHTTADIIKRAELLRTDSVHGAFKGTIDIDSDAKALIVNGHIIKLISSKSPENIDYEPYGISNALILDNTGAFRDRESLSKHLSCNGVGDVLLTAPGKGDIPNLVYGVNHLEHNQGEKVYSAASCTTNAIAPVLKVVHDNFQIEHGHIETVHAYTNDQNLLDNFHKKARRGRSAALNMVITETGAAKAISKVLPPLEGKFTGNAVRVPTPNVSLAILHLRCKKETSKEELNDILKNASFEGALCEQIEYSVSNELVSADIVGNIHAGIVDGAATIVDPNKRNIVLYVWYDNEYGYTRQVIRLSNYIADNLRLTYY